MRVRFGHRRVSRPAEPRGKGASVKAHLWSITQRALATGLLMGLAGAATAAPPPEGSVPSADGLSIHYLDSGQGDASVVLIHGWAASAAIWRAQLGALAPSYRVVRVDLAGHGGSGKGRERYTQAAFGQDVAAVVKALKLQKVVLVGHAMGGSVALEAARLLPGIVHGVVGVDSLQDAEAFTSKAEVDRIIRNLQVDFRRFVSTHVQSGFHIKPQPTLVGQIVSELASTSPDVAASTLREMLSYDQRERFRLAGVPIVCINSDVSLTNDKTNRTYAPSFSLITLKNSNRFVLLEDPARLNRMLQAVLHNLLGTGAREGRRLVKEVEVTASRDAVWLAWTTTGGTKEFFAPLTRVELMPGGAYEMFFEPAGKPGSRGSEGSRVLSFLPMSLLSFEWSFPATFQALRANAAKTWVVVELEERGSGKVKVRLTQLGWQEGVDWDRAYSYFDKMWDGVLGRLQRRFTPDPASPGNQAQLP